MPTYAWQCSVCAKQFEVWSKISERNEPQQHCGAHATRIMNAPMVAPLFESYRAIGRGRPWIRTKAEHKAYLRENNYEEVGNDSSMAPPPICDREFAHQQAEKLKEIEQSFQELGAVEKHLE